MCNRAARLSDRLSESAESIAFVARRPEVLPPLVNRNVRADETTRRACEKFALVPTSVMNFAEGTRFTAEKHARQRSPYRHLLKTRAGAMALASLEGFTVGITADRRWEEQAALLERRGARVVHGPAIRTLPLTTLCGASQASGSISGRRSPRASTDASAGCGQCRLKITASMTRVAVQILVIEPTRKTVSAS